MTCVAFVVHVHFDIQAVSVHMWPLTDDHNLRRAVEQGHKWWVLKEDIPPESATLIYNYRNSDQNTNQVHIE